MFIIVLSFIGESVVGRAISPTSIGGTLLLNSEPATSGIEVTLIPQDQDGDTPVSGYTDNNGQFTVDNTDPAQNYYAEISNGTSSGSVDLPQTFDMLSESPFVSAYGNREYEIPDISINLDTSTINATVLDSSNTPVDSSPVTATSTTGSSIATSDGSEIFDIQPGSIATPVTTGTDGAASLNVFSGELYTVCATAPAGGQYCNQNVGSDTSTAINLPATYSVSGTISFNSTPLPAGALITLTSSDGLYSANAFTDSSGSFNITGLPNDSYFINIDGSAETTSPGSSAYFNITSTTAYVDVNSNDTTLPVLSLSTSSLNVNVINDNNVPISDTQVSMFNTGHANILTSDGSEAFTDNESDFGAITDSSGNVTIGAFAGEIYSACASNYDTQQNFCTLDVTAGSSATINYISDYSVSGILTPGPDPSGYALTSVTSASTEEMLGNNYVDGSGSFETDNLTNGSYYLNINYDGGLILSSVSPYLDINGSDIVTNPSFDTSTLTVNVLDAYGNPVEGAGIAFFPTSNISPVYTTDGLEAFTASGTGVFSYTNTGIGSTSVAVIPNETYTICGYTARYNNTCINNVGSNSGSVTIELVQPPIITYSLSSSPNSNGWYNKPVTVTFNCSAEVLVSCSAPVTLSADGANQVVTGTATDYNGFTTSASVTLNIDQTPPVLGTPTLTINPIITGQSTTLSAPIESSLSGVVAEEFYLGVSDPGEGNGTPMNWDGTNFTATLGPDLATGTYVVNVRGEDNAGNWSNVTVTTLTVNSPPTTAPSITSPQIDHINARIPVNFTITAAGTPIPSITESGTLPPGLTFVDNGDGTATISGQASTINDGYYFLTITATNSVGSTTQTLVITVDDALSPPTLISANSATATYGSAFSFTVDTTGDPIPTINKTGALPPGLTLTNNNDGTATIAGTPSGSANGIYSFTINAHNNQGSTTQGFILTVEAPPKIVNIPNQTGIVGTPYNLSVSSSGTPYASFSSSTLPNGLNLTDNGNGTATITGSPSVGSGGSYTITVIATNAFGSNSNTFTMKIDEPPAITSASSAVATTSTVFNFQVTSIGYPAPTYSLTGTLPSGLHFNSNTGLFSGTPRTGTLGTYTFTITASNSLGSSGQNFSLTIN